MSLPPPPVSSFSSVSALASAAWAASSFTRSSRNSALAVSLRKDIGLLLERGVLEGGEEPSVARVEGQRRVTGAGEVEPVAAGGVAVVLVAEERVPGGAVELGGLGRVVRLLGP